MVNNNRKRLSKFLLIMMITFIALLGIGVAGQGVVHAVDFNINVPEIQSDFPTDLAGTPTTEISWWEKAGNWISDTWDGFTDWCSETWKALMDSINEILDDLGEFISENLEEILAGIALLAGVVFCFIPGTQWLGIGILFGILTSGGLTWLEGGSFKDICKSIFTGGLIGAAGGVFGGLVSKALTSVISRFAPTIASKLGNLLGFGAMGVHDSALEDVLYNRKIDWKKAIVTGGFSMALIFGGGKLAPPLVNFINDLPNPFAKTVVQTVDRSTFQNFANEKIGDTKFGDFLNWFVKGESGNGSKALEEGNIKQKTIEERFAEGEFLASKTEFPTGIDDKVTIIDQQLIWKGDIPTFTKSQYRTVVTNEEITLYRVYGNKEGERGALKVGSFATTSPAKSRVQVQRDSALLPEWGNTMEKEVTITIPKGTTINIGKVAPQTAKDTGIEYPGGGDQILLPYPAKEEWFGATRDVPIK